jgi:predicted ATPase with chaperone activity
MIAVGIPAASCQVPGCENLLQLSAHLHDRERLIPQQSKPEINTSLYYPDLSDVKGQTLARRTLETATAEKHNLLFCRMICLRFFGLIT